MALNDTNKHEVLRVLNLEDSPNDSELIEAELETEWSRVEFLRVETRDAFVRALHEFKPDIVLSDFNLPDMNGKDALNIVRHSHPDIPVIMVTGALGEVETVELVKLGARDYVMKDHLQRLSSAVHGALSLEQGIRARKAAEKSLRQSEAEIRQLVERSPIAMIVDVGAEADERVVMMNQRFTDLFGYTLEDIPDVHHWWLRAYPDEQYREELRAEWIVRVEQAIQLRGEIEPMESTVSCKDGSIRYVRISFASIGNRNIITFVDLTKRRRLEDSLKEAADLNRAITETANDAIICINPDGIIYLWNKKAEAMFGYAAAEAIGSNLHELITPQHYREQAEQAMRFFARTGNGPIVGTSRQLDARRKDGSEFPIELSVSAMNVHGEWHATGIIRDITERKLAEKKIERLNRLYETLGLCNQAIVRSTGETELLAQVCAAIVKFGSFRMAWIGWVDPATYKVIPAVSAGKGTEAYLQGIELSVEASSEYGRGPTGTAIRENRPFWCEDFLGSPFTGPWRERAAAHGWRSSAALPLHRDGVAVGAITMYADEPYVFEEDVRTLLIEMTQDVDYALANFSHEGQRKRAEDELRKLSLAVEQSPSSIVITDLDARLEYVNDAFVKSTGYSREEALGQNPRILQSGKTPRAAYDDMWAHLTRGETWKGELFNKRKDGSEYIESMLMSPVRDTDGRATHYLAIKEDVTERKQAEEKLLKLTLAVEQSPNSIMIADLKGNIEYVNQAFVIATGYSRDEVIGQNPRLLHSGKNPRETYLDMWAHLQRGESWKGELINRRKNGSEHIEAMSILPIRDAEGHTTHYLAIKDDVTERRRVERALLESEEKFRVMTASAQDAIVMIDNDGNISFWNIAAEKTFGYSAQEALGKNLHLLITPVRFYEAADKGFAHFKQTGEGAVVGKTLELPALHKDGHEFPVELSLSAVLIDGKWQAIGIMRDITERKRSEEMLRTSEERLQLAQMAASVGTWDWNLASDVAQCSDSYFDIFGISPGSATPPTYAEWLERIYPEDRAHAEADIRQAQESGADYRSEYRIVRPDGGIRWLESKARLKLDAEGKPLSMLGAVMDITDRKEIEAKIVAQYEHVAGVNAQLLDANKQLEQAKSQVLQSEKMASIGLLAAGVAHEINNPVGYVNSNLGTLEKYMADIFAVMDKYEAVEELSGENNPALEELRQFKARVDLDYLREDIKSLIAESHQGLERIKKIILDLKDFSHADTEEHWVWADLHHGLDSTLNVVWNELKYKCEVVKEYGDLPDIYCLPSQLNQVFMNLLVNAAQAIEVRGRITIRTGHEGERVWVEVGDSGHGIPPEILPRLFDPFFTTKPVGKGTGLGLSVSYKIVEKHHGKIEIHSEVGKGSTFRVWLPVQPSVEKIRGV